MAEQDVAPTPTDQPAAAGGASATAHIGAIVLGLGLLVGAVSNQPVSLSNQLLPQMPAPGLLAARVLVGLVSAGLLVWGLGGLWFGPAVIQLRPRRLGRRAPAAESPAETQVAVSPAATDALDPSAIEIRLRDEAAIVVSEPASGFVDSIAVWFTIVSHLDVDVVLDRIVLCVRAGQPVLYGVMAHQTLIRRHSTVSTILFEDTLSASAAAMIQKRRDEVRQGGSAQFQVTGRAYFDSELGPFEVELRYLQRAITA